MECPDYDGVAATYSIINHSDTRKIFGVSNCCQSGRLTSVDKLDSHRGMWKINQLCGVGPPCHSTIIETKWLGGCHRYLLLNE